MEEPQDNESDDFAPLTPLPDELTADYSKCAPVIPYAPLFVPPPPPEPEELEAQETFYGENEDEEEAEPQPKPPALTPGMLPEYRTPGRKPAGYWIKPSSLNEAEFKEVLDEFYAWRPVRLIAAERRINIMSLTRYLLCRGHFDTRISNKANTLKSICTKAFEQNGKISVADGLKAMEMLLKMQGDIKTGGDVNVQVNNIPSVEEFKVRMQAANRLKGALDSSDEITNG